MICLTSVREMQEAAAAARKEDKSIGFVPTMGYLHEGHLSLVEASKKDCGLTVMSIFVNPLQFGEGEDFESYPRDTMRDKQLAEARGVDILFIPEAEEMYPRPMSAVLNVQKGTDVLCGASRPGHFDGVATVVMKLFQIVQPDKAYFGRKDAQQVAVITNMAEDFHLDIEVVPAPVQREQDGLAMSSRNVRLLPQERKEAPLIFEILKEASEQIRSTKNNTPAVEAREKLEALSGELDYLELRTYPMLEKAEGTETGTLLLAAAVKYSSVRLIDNMMWEQ